MVEELYEVDTYPIIDNPLSVEAKKYEFPAPRGFTEWNYERRYITASDKSGLKVLFIRDSFCDQLKPFISCEFKESLFIFDAWNYNLNKPIIQTIKPDIVVFLSFETNLDQFIL